MGPQCLAGILSALYGFEVEDVLGVYLGRSVSNLKGDINLPKGFVLSCKSMGLRCLVVIDFEGFWWQPILEIDLILNTAIALYVK